MESKMEKVRKKKHIIFTTFLVALSLVYTPSTQAIYSEEEFNIIAENYENQIDFPEITFPLFMTGRCYQQIRGTMSIKEIKVLLNPNENGELLFYGTFYFLGIQEAPYKSIEEVIEQLVHSAGDSHIATEKQRVGQPYAGGGLYWSLSKQLGDLKLNLVYYLFYNVDDATGEGRFSLMNVLQLENQRFVLSGCKLNKYVFNKDS